MKRGGGDEDKFGPPDASEAGALDEEVHEVLLVQFDAVGDTFFFTVFGLGAFLIVVREVAC